MVRRGAPSILDFTPVFNAAINKFYKITGKSLDTHPFAEQLGTCRNPEAVSKVFQIQVKAFRRNQFLTTDAILMLWLDPIIQVLHILSETLGEGIGLVSILGRLHMTVLRHPILSHFHLPKKSSPRSVFFSKYVLRPVLIAVLHNINLLGSEGCDKL